MTDKRAIVEDLARGRVVEEMIENISGRSISVPELQDLAQMVYLVLLEYDAAKVADLYDNGEIRFFIARIILNQYRSTTSTFYYRFRKFLANARPLEGYDTPDG